MKSICVYITTYNRPDELLDLLQDINREAIQSRKCFLTDVRVYDDASGRDYAEVRSFLSARSWAYMQAEHNYGKHRYWEWMNVIYRDLRRKRSAYYIQLPDDVRLCNGFFSKIIDQWEAIPDGRKAALNPLHDLRRSTGPCWTGVEPTRAGPVDRVGWVDLCQLSTRDFFVALDWHINSIPHTRWSRDASVSSGVGSQISRRLLSTGHTLYRSSRSLVVHRFLASKMNPEERRRSVVVVKEYVDGAAEGAVLAAGDAVTATLASIPARVNALEQVVASLLPQVGRVHVYLNGYDGVPEFLENPRISVGRSQETGDNGDAGKFWWSDNLSGYCLTCDDDLVYPKDYAAQLISAIQTYGSHVVVGVHGARVVEPVISYYTSRTVFHCLGDVPADAPVHILGTGALAYHTSAIRVTRSDFKAPNMADVWFAKLGREQGVRLVCLGHKKGWLQHIRHQETVYTALRNHDALQTEVIRALVPWSLKPTTSKPAGVALPLPSRGTVARPARRGRGGR